MLRKQRQLEPSEAELLIWTFRVSLSEMHGTMILLSVLSFLNLGLNLKKIKYIGVTLVNDII